MVLAAVHLTDDLAMFGGVAAAEANEKVKASLDELCRRKYIARMFRTKEPDSEVYYDLTEQGRVFGMGLVRVPYPKQVWTLPAPWNGQEDD
jgi:hypothetical protein